MKKLYRKGTVHPSSPAVSDHLSFLPATILTLAAALSSEDREVLAYLLLISNNNNSSADRSSHRRKPSSSSSSSCAAAAGSQRSCLPSKSDHPPMFSCDCFGCYTSYWVRWDCSPSRELIHEIIDQFEDGLLKSSNTKGSSTNKTKKERRKPMRGKADSGQLSSSSRESKGFSSEVCPGKDGLGGSFLESAESGTSDGSTNLTCSGEVAEEGAEKGPLRRLVSFMGEKIWGVWN